MMSRQEDVQRIREALIRAQKTLEPFVPGRTEHRFKEGDDPVTEADMAVNQTLLDLPRDDEGWLSEETADNPSRLSKRRVWIVDPLDGTREFVAGIPEWCISIALVEDGVAVAGGICNPSTGETVVGSLDTGVSLNGAPCRTRQLVELHNTEILASRSEVKRGEWKRFDSAPFRVRPMGSVAYKLALVAAGRADATWTLVPKHEWDVAAGTALVEAAGGVVCTPDGMKIRFNRETPRLPGLLAAPAELAKPIREFLQGQSD